MNIEKYKKKLEEWKVEHNNFYNEYVHALKSDKSTLTTYMHVYEFAMMQIPDLPSNIELGACGDLFNIYFEKYGFNKLIGMLVSVIGNDKLLGIKSIVQRNKLKKAIVAWLVLGDLHTCIINKIISFPDNGNYEESLNQLIYRLVKNSIITGLKSEDYWRSVQKKKKLFTIDAEMEKCIALVKKEIAVEEDAQQMKSRPGRKPKFNDLKEITLEGFIEYSTGDPEKAKLYTPKIVEQLSCYKKGEDLAALTVALEYLGIITCIDNGGVRTFWRMLRKKCNTIVGYEAMNDNYKILEVYNKKGKVPPECASGRKKISDSIEIFQEINRPSGNIVQETSIKAN